jgi:hypothetical protein
MDLAYPTPALWSLFCGMGDGCSGTLDRRRCQLKAALDADPLRCLQGTGTSSVDIAIFSSRRALDAGVALLLAGLPGRFAVHAARPCTMHCTMSSVQ